LEPEYFSTEKFLPAGRQVFPLVPLLGLRDISKIVISLWAFVVGEIKKSRRSGNKK